MSLAQALNPKRYTTEELGEWTKDIAGKIRLACKPAKIILFGSAAEGRFKEGSDLDFLLIFSDVLELKHARTSIRRQGPLFTKCPVDLLFVTQEHFDKMKGLGGVCFIAAHDGLEL